jgi:hypothetical protein
MTFTVKVRGGAGLLVAEYLCPVHGRFEQLVERDANGEPPSVVSCGFDSWSVAGGDKEYASREDAAQAALEAGYSDPETASCETQRCANECPWTISAGAVHTQFVITASHGKPDPKPHPKAMDTRMLAEGRRKEFRQQRRKIREEERHARLKRFLS